MKYTEEEAKRREAFYARRSQKTVERMFQRNEEKWNLPKPVFMAIFELSQARHAYHSRGHLDILLHPYEYNESEAKYGAACMLLDAVAKAYPQYNKIAPDFNYWQQIKDLRQDAVNIQKKLERGENILEDIILYSEKGEKFNTNIENHLFNVDFEYDTDFRVFGAFRDFDDGKARSISVANLLIEKRGISDNMKRDTDEVLDSLNNDVKMKIDEIVMKIEEGALSKDEARFLPEEIMAAHTESRNTKIDRRAAGEDEWLANISDLRDAVDIFALNQNMIVKTKEKDREDDFF